MRAVDAGEQVTVSMHEKPFCIIPFSAAVYGLFMSLSGSNEKKVGWIEPGLMVKL